MRSACTVVVLAILLTVSGLAVVPAGSADADSLPAAGRIEGVSFAPSIQMPGADLQLCGLGLMRWKILFKAYVAALYLGEGCDSGQALSDVPKRLELHYFYNIRGKAFADAGRELLRRSRTAEELAAIEPGLAKLDTLYRDVAPGDRYALTYVPGEGTVLSWNGKPLGRIEGEAFAAAYFSIWLGEKSIDESLRSQLLASLSGG